MTFFRVPVLLLFGCLLWRSDGSAATIIYGLTNTPDTDSNTACGSGCPDLRSATGRDIFSLVGPSTVNGFTFWTFESPGSYGNGSLDWRILTDVNNAPGTVLGSGQFTMLPRNFVQSVTLAGFSLDEYQNDVVFGSPLAINPVPSPQNYFLEIHDGSSSDSFGIFWATSQTGTLAFQLSGSGNLSGTPEPAAFWLACSALAGLAVWRRSRTTR